MVVLRIPFGIFLVERLGVPLKVVDTVLHFLLEPSGVLYL